MAEHHISDPSELVAPAVSLDPDLVSTWQRDRCLGRAELAWIDAHAAPGDPHPITSAITELRAMAVKPRHAVSLVHRPRMGEQ